MFQGIGGAIELFDDRLVIHRKGVMAFLGHGLKGEKSIPYASVTAVQFKKSGLFTNGYIQFSVAGGLDSKKGIWDATCDENTVMFTAAAEESFAKLRSYVEAKITTQRAGSAAVSAADELEKFAALRDKGIISAEEFSLKKKAILGL